jgi:hypothetical protein
MRVSKRIRLEDLGLELRLLPTHIGEAATEALDLEWMVAAAKSFCPIDTATLMASIRAERRGLYESALIAGGGGWVNPKTGREVDYAKPVHDGTSRMLARPFLLQAVVQERLRLVRQMFEGTAEAVQ